nr:MAG TPA: hypothetical protein [Bacteriophage sp.]DAO71004.1 MAG TPA: hypothetical protein [Caudoviricetes sp.]
MLLLCSLTKRVLVNFIMMHINQILTRQDYLWEVVRQYMKKLSYTSI